VPADVAYLDLVGAFVLAMAHRAGFGERDAARVRLAVDEACSNAMRHGSGCEERVRVACSLVDGAVEYRVWDCAPGFDLEQVGDPQVDAPLEKRKIGGLGIYLMRRIMDEVRVEPCAVGKEVVLAKRLL
jgi:anti-sigma regulatory factor (Ser/Thr protein kinase)